MNSQLFVHNPIWNGQALQLLQELSSLCYFWMYTSTFCYTVALYLQHSKKINRPNNNYLSGLYFSA